MTTSLIDRADSDHLTAQSFASTQEFMLGVRFDAPGCLVLERRLPERSGLELTQELARSDNRLPIVSITGRGDVFISVIAMKAEAIECLAKPFRDQGLLDAVHGGVAPDRSRTAEGAMLSELRQHFVSLTSRERVVMALVVSGRLNNRIATELDLGEITVKVHQGQIMRKMQGMSLPDLARFADRLAADTTKP